jgi:hypothetical protein
MKMLKMLKMLKQLIEHLAWLVACCCSPVGGKDQDQAPLFPSLARRAGVWSIDGHQGAPFTEKVLPAVELSHAVRDTALVRFQKVIRLHLCCRMGLLVRFPSSYPHANMRRD